MRNPVQCFDPREVNSASVCVSFFCPAEGYTKRYTKLIVDAVFRVTRCKQLAQPPLEGASRGSGASVAPGNRGHVLRASSPSPHGLRLRCLKLRPLAEQFFPPAPHPHSEPRMSWVCGVLELTFESDSASGGSGNQVT